MIRISHLLLRRTGTLLARRAVGNHSSAEATNAVAAYTSSLASQGINAATTMLPNCNNSVYNFNWEVLLNDLNEAAKSKRVQLFTRVLEQFEQQVQAVMVESSSSGTQEASPLCPLSPSQTAHLMQVLSYLSHVRMTYRCAWAVSWALCCTCDRMSAKEAAHVMTSLRVRKDLFHDGVAATLCDIVVVEAKSSSDNNGEQVPAAERAHELAELLMFIGTFGLHHREFVSAELLRSAAAQLAAIASTDGRLDLLPMTTPFFCGLLRTSKLPHAPLVDAMLRAMLQQLPSANITMLGAFLSYLHVHPEAKLVGAGLIPRIIAEALERFAVIFSVDNNNENISNNKNSSNDNSSSTELTPTLLKQGRQALITARQMINELGAENSSRKELQSNFDTARHMFTFWVQTRVWEQIHKMVVMSANKKKQQQQQQHLQKSDQSSYSSEDEQDLTDSGVFEDDLDQQQHQHGQRHSPRTLSAADAVLARFFPNCSLINFHAAILVDTARSVLNAPSLIHQQEEGNGSNSGLFFEDRKNACLFFLTALIMLKAPHSRSLFMRSQAASNLYDSLITPLCNRLLAARRMKEHGHPFEWSMLSCQLPEIMGVKAQQKKSSSSSNRTVIVPAYVTKRDKYDPDAVAAMQVTVDALREMATDSSSTNNRRSKNASSSNRIHIVVDPRHGSINFLFWNFCELFSRAELHTEAGQTEDEAAAGLMDKWRESKFNKVRREQQYEQSQQQRRQPVIQVERFHQNDDASNSKLVLDLDAADVEPSTTNETKKNKKKRKRSASSRRNEAEEEEPTEISL